MKQTIIFILCYFINSQSVLWKYGNIHIIGDSHSIYSFTNLYTQGVPQIAAEKMDNCEVSTFFYQNKVHSFEVPFHIHWISRTMHMIGRLGLQQVDFRNYDMKDGDFGLMAFGGIDAFHGSIIKQYGLGRELNEIVNELTQRYVETVLMNQRLYNKMTIIIMAIMPPIILEHNKKSYQQRDPTLPYEKFIVASNRMLNEALAYHCNINNFIYLDVNSFFEDEKGLLRYELSDGMHHIKPSYNYILKQKLIDLIIERQC